MTAAEPSPVDAGRGVGSGPLRMFVGAVVLDATMQFAYSQLAPHMGRSRSLEGLSTAEGLLLAQLLGTLVVGAVCVGAVLVWLRRLGKSGGFALERTPLAAACLLLLLAVSAKLGIFAIDWLVMRHDHSIPLDYTLYRSVREFLMFPAVHGWWIALVVVLVAARPPAGLAYVYLALRAGFALYGWLSDPPIRGVGYTALDAFDHGLTALWVALSALSLKGLEPRVCLDSGPSETQVAVEGLRTIRLALWFRVALAFAAVLGLQILLIDDPPKPATLQLASWGLFACELAVTVAVLSGISNLRSLSAIGPPTDGLRTTTIAVVVALGLSALGLALVPLARDASDYQSAKNLMFIANWAPRLALVVGLAGSLAFFSDLAQIGAWAEDPLSQLRANMAFRLTMFGGALGVFTLAYIELGDPGPGVTIVQMFAMLYAAGLTVTLVSITLRDTARALASMSPASDVDGT